MKNKSKFLIRYFTYLVKAKTRHGVHSPFVYKFLEEVLYQDTYLPIFSKIEAQRSKFKVDKRRITVTDLGAGSQVHKLNKRQISGIAKIMAKPPKFARLFYRMIQYYKPKTAIELGTSLGMSTAYMAVALESTLVYTIEGCPNIAAEAKTHLQYYKNVQQYIGNFDLVLPTILPTIGTVDWLFVDGNHREEATIQYFESCLPYSNANSIFIFDDIHWSDGMERAWERIKEHPAVGISIDLFYIGIVFLKPVQQKEHFVVRF